LMLIVGFLSIVFYFVPKDNLLLMFSLQIFIGLALGPKSPLVFSMYADTADYSQYRTGRRATAMIFSAAAFAQKLGGALAGGLMGWLLASMGYVANQMQSGDSMQGIVLLMTLIPGVFALIAVFIIRLYPLKNKEMLAVQNALNTDLGSKNVSY